MIARLIAMRVPPKPSTRFTRMCTSLSFAGDPFDPDDAWDVFSQSIKPTTPAKSVARSTPKPRTPVPTPNRLPESASHDGQDATHPSAHLTPVIQPRAQKGKTPQIQAQLDLHGFTQELAFKRLCDVVHRSCANGVRFILVITGKGNPLTGTGIIQRELPRWCQMSALSAHIISCGFAPPALGGKGAYILHLRTKNRRPTP